MPIKLIQEKMLNSGKEGQIIKKVLMPCNRLEISMGLCRERCILIMYMQIIPIYQEKTSLMSLVGMGQSLLLSIKKLKVTGLRE